MPKGVPPVFLTIAAVHHEPIMAIAEHFPTIQDRLRRRGWAGDVEQMTLDQPGGQGPALIHNAFVLRDLEGTSALTFNSAGVFACHTVAYKNREAFMVQFREGLETLREVVELTTMRRVGMRMLDLVRPAEAGVDMAAFIAPTLLGFQGLTGVNAWQSLGGGMEHRFTDGDATVTMRFDRHPTRFAIRPDMANALSDMPVPDWVVGGEGMEHGVLDIDSGSTFKARSFDLDAIMAELAAHKRRLRLAFDAAVTPSALAYWGLRRD